MSEPAGRHAPAVGAVRGPHLPGVDQRELSTGLRVLAARRTGVPKVETRLRIPVVGTRTTGDGARERLLADTLPAGTTERSSLLLAQDLQRLGASMRAGMTSDELVVSGSVLSENLGSFLALLAEVLDAAAFPDDEVTVAQGRAAQEVTIARSQPTVMAGDALVQRLYGKHPYGRGLPAAQSFEAVTPIVLRRAHAGRIVPAGAVLVLVGDIRTDTALDEAAAILTRWSRSGKRPELKPPSPPSPSPTLLLDRPGSVQTNIRLGGAAVPRDHPDHPRVQIANMVFGGYFTSRLVTNLREEKGYSYSPRSSISHRLQASQLTVAAEVATEVTVAALLEIRYELARMAAGRIDEGELAAAQRYLIGTLALATQTQAGLASQVSALAAAGLNMNFLVDYPRQLEQVTADDVLDAGLRYLGPRGLQTVLVGRADAVQRQLESIDAVEVKDAS
jgi:predicted Zn-dependent peptidase